MASTDLDGKPMLILKLTDAMFLQRIMVGSTLIVPTDPLFLKINDFISEASNPASWGKPFK